MPIGATTTPGGGDTSGKGWAAWHDAGLDCASVASTTRAWDVSGMNKLRLLVNGPSQTTVPNFTCTVQWSLTGEAPDWFSASVTFDQTSISGGASYQTDEIDVDSVRFVRVVPTSAAGSALAVDLFAYASNTVALALA